MLARSNFRDLRRYITVSFYQLYVSSYKCTSAIMSGYYTMIMYISYVFLTFFLHYTQLFGFACTYISFPMARKLYRNIS